MSNELALKRRSEAEEAFGNYDFSDLGEIEGFSGWENGFDGDSEFLSRTVYVRDESGDDEEDPKPTLRGKFIVNFVSDESSEIDSCDAYLC